MARAAEIISYAIVVGAGATAVMDLWAAFLRRYGVSTLDYALLGRWIGHFPRGQFVHESIGKAAPVRYERIIGWSAHYAIGVLFAAAPVAILGFEWVRRPTLAPALIISFVTLVAPFFVMQPATGAGIAASKTSRPDIARLRSIATHTVYGVWRGLFRPRLAPTRSGRVCRPCLRLLDRFSAATLAADETRITPAVCARCLRV
jgi:hypothetical protein